MGNFYTSNEYWFAVFQLVTAMFGMGAALTISDFRKVFSQPLPATCGTLIQLVFVPLFSWFFIVAMDLSPGMAIGIALIASVPGGSSSNIFTYFAKGNVTLSISITIITTTACLFTTPFVLNLLAVDHMPSNFEMPTLEIVREIAFTLLTPLLLGMAVLKATPQIATQISRWSIRASVMGLIMITVGSATSGRLDIEKFGHANLLAMLLFVTLLVLVGWLLPRLIRLKRSDSVAIELEVVVRNVNLGIMLKALLFPVIIGTGNQIGDTVLFCLLIYGAAEMTLGVAISYFRKVKSKEEFMNNSRSTHNN